MRHAQQPRFEPCHRHALFAFEVTGLGLVHGELRELGGGVAPAIDWALNSARWPCRAAAAARWL